MMPPAPVGRYTHKRWLGTTSDWVRRYAPQAAETVNSVILRMGYHIARRGLTSFRTGYISRPMATMARPEHTISRTPRVIGARSGSPSTNAWIMVVPNMAATIWTTNRMPTVVAVLLRDFGLSLLNAGAVVVLRLVMACLFSCVRSGPENRF